MTVVGFLALAALATLARAMLTAGQQPTSIPWRTFAINVAGSFVLGWMLGHGWHDRMTLTVAGLGSFTTFSTVAAEAIALVENGRKRHAIAYLGLTLVVGIAAAWLGLSIGDSR